MLLLSPSDRVCRASRLRRVPAPGWPAAVTFLLCLRPRLLPSVPRTPRPCTSESRWVDSGQRTRTPTNPVSECSAIAGLVALTTAASRWRHCVPFVPFAAPLCSLFPRRVTCAPFENFYFVILNPFFFVYGEGINFRFRKCASASPQGQDHLPQGHLHAATRPTPGSLAT